MRSFVNTRWFTLPQLHLPVIVGAILLGSLSAGALPKPGTPAPPLQFTHLLQAPQGARANWPALHGKVVVLEFWSTTCAPCFASMPHLNQLAATLDPARFQFIFVDDEEPKIVQSFLSKRKMAGWVGLDITGKVLERFGVWQRPTTIIVGTNGRIVATTLPEHLETSDLRALADGKSVKFEAAEIESASTGKATTQATARPLFEISLSKAAPDAKLGMTRDRAEGWVRGASAEFLLTYTYDIPKDRLLLVSPLPDGLYNLHGVFADKEDVSTTAPVVQLAIASGLRLRVNSKIVTRKAYVLKATEASKRLLIPLLPIDLSGHHYSNGMVRLVNGSMDDLAAAVEEGLEVPVVNETGIEGKFDAILEFPAKDAVAAKAVLLKTLGLELIEAERPIRMLEVSSRESSKKAAESKPKEAPKK